MNVCVINYSSRKNGNGYHISEYVMDIMSGIGCKVGKIDFSLLTLNVCGKCNYECFNKSCVYKDDDIYTAYRNLINTELVISVIPIYGGLPCSNFFAFSERAQGAFNDEEFEKLERISNKYIVIGNTGFDITKRIVFENDKHATDKDFLAISSNEVGERSINGNLMDYPCYQKKIRNFLC